MIKLSAIQYEKLPTNGKTFIVYIQTPRYCIVLNAYLAGVWSDSDRATAKALYIMNIILKF